LVLLRAKSEGIYVDTGIRVTGVVLERLDNIEVCSLTLGEAVLAVKLKLSGNNRVLTPAVHVKSGLGKHEGTSIRYERTSVNSTCRVECVVRLARSPLNTSILTAHSTRILEKTSGGDELVSTRGLVRTTESMDSVRKSVDSIGIVERLSTKSSVKGLATLQRSTVINVSIRLNNPDQLLTRVVEVQLDLVGRGTNRLVTSKLKLFNQVLVRVLGHLSTLIGVKEDIVDVKGSSNKRLLVSSRNRLRSAGSSKGLDSPQALTNRTEVNVDLDLVVLKSNQRKGKSRVAAKPEKKRNVKGGLRKSVARSAHLGWATSSSTRSADVSEGRISDVC